MQRAERQTLPLFCSACFVNATLHARFGCYVISATSVKVQGCCDVTLLLLLEVSPERSCSIVAELTATSGKAALLALQQKFWKCTLLLMSVNVQSSAQVVCLS